MNITVWEKDVTDAVGALPWRPAQPVSDSLLFIFSVSVSLPEWAWPQALKLDRPEVLKKWPRNNPQSIRMRVCSQ